MIWKKQINNGSQIGDTKINIFQQYPIRIKNKPFNCEVVSSNPNFENKIECKQSWNFKLEKAKAQEEKQTAGVWKTMPRIIGKICRDKKTKK